MAENAEPLWFYQDPRTRATVMIVRSDKFEECKALHCFRTELSWISGCGLSRNRDDRPGNLGK
jgi:hypothetical protein